MSTVQLVAAICLGASAACCLLVAVLAAWLYFARTISERRSR